MNCLGGNMMVGDTSKNSKLLSGPLKSFWKLLNDDNWVVNWSGEVSPVVHQINHFIEELKDLVTKNTSLSVKDKSDYAWQALSASRCLWGC